MKVTWQVDDGYAGGSRPKTTIIDDDEIAEYETEEEKEDFIHECIQEDFDNRISWYVIRRE